MKELIYSKTLLQVTHVEESALGFAFIFVSGLLLYGFMMWAIERATRL